MHTFVDAGENGMAAVVYLRFEEDGLVECALVGAKTRVTPLRYLSIPRSELQAAVIGTRLANTVTKSFSLRISQRYFWCDSRNVLCWLRSDHRRYSQYVAARVREVLDTTEIDEWHWIQSEWNVADDGTNDEKYPIILPDDHPVTHLVLADFHERYHHRNYATVANEVRRRFCIPRLRRTLRKMRHRCQWCRNCDVSPVPPEMAELPQARLAAFSRPFSHVGVDFFGPIEVIVGRKVEKRWGVLMTCLTIRALHIEVASSLNTSSCIMALNNFIARRGTPVCFYSDRGTNFIGASKELREAVRALDKHQLSKEFTTASTSWRFNPPATPHMGGSWERLVQLVKRNLTEILRSRRPTDEELRSALTLIEGVLNSRPLTEVPVDNESEPALTPNHFLLGSSDGSKPFTLCDDNVQTVRRGWQVSQVMANAFWKRWLRNYLPEITKRSKSKTGIDAPLQGVEVRELPLLLYSLMCSVCRI
ncbi:uncharacterized protein LOC129773742 [Toxorhynchites rutilus septentrionalis]|uniref:uncharacterized protein LOC129773742 n=1 Tax=Toxorhynchites rutilus septentrionalis TaxID=329112 RepID=UPI00247A565E|nr:uncharacterized protein LOC129773742 [Toxorhynchites rutilus septentrionalis]